MKTDLELTSDIVSALVRETNVDTTKLGISVRRGAVAITGSVPSHDQKSVCIATINSVEGVKDISDHTSIGTANGGQPSDAEIAAAAVNAIKWITTVPEQGIGITVDDGWITLLGTVDDLDLKSAAEDAVRGLRGSRGVYNLIKVSPRASAESDEEEQTNGLLAISSRE